MSLSTPREPMATPPDGPLTASPAATADATADASAGAAIDASADATETAPAASGRSRFVPGELWLLAAVTLLLAGLDQYTKGAVVDRLGPLARTRSGQLRPPAAKKPIDVVPGALRFTLTGNEGAIFGVGRDWSARLRTPLFYALSILAISLVVLLLFTSEPGQWGLRLGLAAVLSGALGNSLDRVRLDYVVDFIDWYAGFRWPTFNVADVAITVGSVAVLVSLWRSPAAPREA